MSYKNLFLSLFFILFAYLTDKTFHFSDSHMFYLGAIFLPIIFLLIVPSIGSKDKKDQLARDRASIIVDIKEENEEEVFHNDFSRVGSADDPRPPKPMDFASDPIKEAKDQQEHDLKFLKK